MIADAILLALLPGLLAYACFSDLFTMRISNRVCLFVAGLFPLAAAAAGMGAADIGMHVAAGLAVLLVSFSLFAFGWIGGGDAKLVAATAVWFGFEQTLEYIGVSCVLGGLLTIALLWARQQPLPAGMLHSQWIFHLHNQKTGVPYGVALGIAALIMLPGSPIWRLAL